MQSDEPYRCMGPTYPIHGLTVDSIFSHSDPFNDESLFESGAISGKSFNNPNGFQIEMRNTISKICALLTSPGAFNFNNSSNVQSIYRMNQRHVSRQDRGCLNDERENIGRQGKSECTSPGNGDYPKTTDTEEGEHER
jgi:hypothetical protein